jgi:hypothetical protein
MTVSIEWVVEALDPYGDIIDLLHSDTYAEAEQLAEALREEHGVEVQVGLVRDRGNDVEGILDRSWAYVVNGALPVRFEPGNVLVPKRYHLELQRSK